MNDMHEQHAVSDFSDFNNRPRFALDSLILQAQVRANPITEGELLEFIAKNFSGLDFGRGSDPDKQSGYLQPTEDGFFTVMHARAGELTFRCLGEHDFKTALSILMSEWR